MRMMLRMFWVFLILITAAGYLMFDGPVLLVLACFFTIAGLFLHVLLVWRKFRIKVRLSTERLGYFRKDPARIFVKLSERSRNPSACVAVRTEFRASGGEKKKIRKQTVLSADGRRETVVSWELPSEHCCMWTARIRKVLLYDTVHLFSLCLPVKETKQIFILPEVHPVRIMVESLPETDGNESEHAEERGSDPSVIRQIREYQPGDSIRQMHWKLSARSGQWMIREFGSTEAAGSVMLWLDAGGYPEDMEEKTARWRDNWLTAAVSVTAALIARGICAELVWYDAGREQRFPVTSEQMLMEAACELVCSEPDGRIRTGPECREGQLQLRLDASRRLWKGAECLEGFPEADVGKEAWESVSLLL